MTYMESEFWIYSEILYKVLRGLSRTFDPKTQPITEPVKTDHLSPRLITVTDYSDCRSCTYEDGTRVTQYAIKSQLLWKRPNNLPEPEPVLETTAEVQLAIKIPVNVANFATDSSNDSTAATDVPIGSNIATDVPKGSNIATDVPKGSNIATDVRKGSTTTTDVPKGSNIATDVPKGSNIATGVRKGSNIATDVRKGSTTTTDVPKGSNIATDVPKGSSIATGVRKGSNIATDVPKARTTATDVPKDSTATTDVLKGSSAANDVQNGSTATTDMPKDSTKALDVPKVSKSSAASNYKYGNGKYVSVPDVCCNESFEMDGLLGIYSQSGMHAPRYIEEFNMDYKTIRSYNMHMQKWYGLFL